MKKILLAIIISKRTFYISRQSSTILRAYSPKERRMALFYVHLVQTGPTSLENE
jgi:hypothetical protein